MQATNLTIANGAAVSEVIDTWGYRVVAVIMPTAWTTADITFQACLTPTGTFVPVVGQDGNLVKCTAVASKWIVLNQDLLAGTRYIKVCSSSTADGSAVNQGAARALTLALRQVAT